MVQSQVSSALTSLTDQHQIEATLEPLKFSKTPFELTRHCLTLQQYFLSFNCGEFEKTAQLFGEQGHLYPPFDSPIFGPKAIAQYLHAEAYEMTATPIRIESPTRCLVETGHNQSVEVARYRIGGRAQNSLFAVNVAWDFDLDMAASIYCVRVNLLATLEELLPFRP